MATDPVSVDTPRPMRADARRNYERIVATAREVFSEQGADAPLDEIVRRAGVGAGTLYRHFPHRDALLEAVYRGEIEQLSARAYELLEEHSPEDALAQWLREQVHWNLHGRGLATTLKAALDRESETFAYCKTTMRTAAAAVLTPAQDAGKIRTDIGPADLLRLSHAVALTAEHATAEDGERLLTVVLDGLRAAP
jgi:AcrR family transcriptional regulator